MRNQDLDVLMGWWSLRLLLAILVQQKVRTAIQRLKEMLFSLRGDLFLQPAVHTQAHIGVHDNNNN